METTPGDVNPTIKAEKKEQPERHRVAVDVLHGSIKTREDWVPFAKSWWGIENPTDEDLLAVKKLAESEEDPIRLQLWDGKKPESRHILAVATNPQEKKVEAVFSAYTDVINLDTKSRSYQDATEFMEKHGHPPNKDGRILAGYARWWKSYKGAGIGAAAEVALAGLQQIDSPEVMSSLDIDEQLVPEDGKIHWVVGGGKKKGALARSNRFYYEVLCRRGYATRIDVQKGKRSEQWYLIRWDNDTKREMEKWVRRLGGQVDKAPPPT